MDILFSVLASLSVIVLNVHGNPSTIRQTANGPVEGVEQTTSLGQKYYAFKGIPYAEAPVTGVDPYTSEDVDRRFKVQYPTTVDKIDSNSNIN